MRKGCKVVFIVTVKEEVDLVLPLCEEILKRGRDDVLIIHTDMFCCDKNGTPPMEALIKSGMPFRSLLSYGTKNIVSILKQEKASALVVGSDQEYMRRAFVYATGGLGISQLMLLMGSSTNKPNAIQMTTKRSIYRISHYFRNIVHKYLYLLRTVVALRWSPYQILRMVLRDFLDAFMVWDNKGKYGCKYIAVAGSWEKQALVERDVSPDKVVITGSPVIRLSLGNKDRALSLRQSLGIGVKDKVILFLTSSQVEHGWWTEDMRNEFINGVVEAVSSLLNESVHLVVKIHPIERLAHYENLLMGKQAIIRKDIVLADAINISDVVLISGSSTTVLEAGVLQKPVVLLKVFNEIDLVPYVEMGLAVGVYSLGELKPIVEGLLYNQESRERCLNRAKLFYDSNSEFTDGKATERIADLIESMV